MSIPIRDFVANRRAELQAAIKAARAELVTLDAVVRALDEAEGQPQRPRRERGSAGSGKKTLKELALEALAENPDGLEATEILGWIKMKYDLDVARESMSPQLSRLGAEGEIVRSGLTWRLPVHTDAAADNEETPGGYHPPGASDDEDYSDLV
jgi:hypothetical protein